MRPLPTLALQQLHPQQDSVDQPKHEPNRPGSVCLMFMIFCCHAGLDALVVVVPAVPADPRDEVIERLRRQVLDLKRSRRCCLAGPFAVSL